MNIQHHLDINGNFYLEHGTSICQITIDRSNDIELDHGNYIIDTGNVSLTEEEQFEFMTNDGINSRSDGDFIALYTTVIYKDNKIIQESILDTCMYQLRYYTESGMIILTPYGMPSKQFKINNTPTGLQSQQINKN